MNIKGGCYCNEIRYESKGEIQASIQCHCRECQYITGGNPNVIMIMPIEGFKFVSGKPHAIKYFNHGGKINFQIVKEIEKNI